MVFSSLAASCCCCAENPLIPTVQISAASSDFTDEASTEIHYWRKHPNLHGWMERLYRAKGGSDRNFNCAAVVLTPDDLRQLEDDLRAGKLPATEGFFFGSSDGTELDDDLKFIESARLAQQSGLTVYYTSWW